MAIRRHTIDTTVDITVGITVDTAVEMEDLIELLLKLHLDGHDLPQLGGVQLLTVKLPEAFGRLDNVSDSETIQSMRRASPWYDSLSSVQRGLRAAVIVRLVDVDVF